MYKKITHNIVEEHFNHPAVLPNSVNPHAMQAVTGILPASVMNENTMIFRMNVRSAWTKWVWSLINYSISLNGNLPGTEQVKTRMQKNAVVLGDMLAPYYGIDRARDVTTALLAIDDIGMRYVEAMKDKKPTAEIVASWQPFIVEIARALSSMNPTNWPEAGLVDVFNKLVKAWQDELVARDKGDLLADEAAVDFINKLIVTGVHNKTPGDFNSLADEISRGIIVQFPSMFMA